MNNRDLAHLLGADPACRCPSTADLVAAALESVDLEPCPVHADDQAPAASQPLERMALTTSAADIAAALGGTTEGDPR